MAVNLTEKFATKVDEKLKLEALTGQAVNNDYEFVGAKTVKVYSIDTVEMGDYKKTGLNRYGEANELSDSVQEMTMSQDKSFTFTIDKMNGEESNGARQAGEALARQIRERVIPMVDLYRLGEMAKKAGTKATASNLTKTNVADAILAGTEALDNAEVSIVGRQLFVTPATYKLMKQSADIVLDTEIGQDTIIYPFTYIEGENKIGKSCKIGPCAHLRGGVEVCDNVKVGNFVEVKKSKISSNTNVGHLSYIGDSELGEHVNIGAGTITANYNPLTKEKSKTILKDNVKIGSNSVLVAPVTVEEGTNVGAGTIVTKDLPAWALAITRSPLKILENWVKKQLNK